MTVGHAITPNQWFELLEDSLPAPERNRIQAHLDECRQCRELYRDIRAWESVVRSEATLLSSALDRGPEEIDRLALRALREIRRSEPRDMAQAFRFGEGVLLLRALLDPLCGKGAARNAVKLATEQSCTSGESSVAASNWGLFVRNLGAAIGAVYGVPARVLIERVGLLVEAEVC